MSKILAVIPARGGSKGIPRKNIRLLGGKPLIAYSIEAGLQSKYIDRVTLSTDDKEIGELAEKYGAEVIVRPKELADDKAMCDPVLKHAVESLEAKDGYVPDIVVLLPPTSPLRNAEHIDRAIEKFEANDHDSLISVFMMSNNRHEIVEGNTLTPTFAKSKNRDERPVCVFENGAIYISKTRLIREGRIRGDKIGYYEMDRYASIDIDTLRDFEVAEKLLVYDKK